MRKTIPMMLLALLLGLFWFLPFAFAANFVVGDVVQVQNTGNGGLKVRSSPCVRPDNWDGTVKLNGALGYVLNKPSGYSTYPVYCSDEHYWWKIRWGDGKEGWSADGDEDKAWLAKVSVTPSSKFTVNDNVQVSGTGSSLSVRSDPTELAYQTGVPEGTKGTVIGGPVYGVPKDSSEPGFYHFWKVDFGTAVGWAAEKYLAKVAAPGNCGDYPGVDECYLIGENKRDVNWETGSRGASQINYTVIHTTGINSSFDETSVKNSFRDNLAFKASAHYMVTRSGKVIQFVRDKDVSYHAGNYAYNLQSIGIEHEGYANDPNVYANYPAMVEASAKLVKWLADTYKIPIRHDGGSADTIIGHHQVACPCTDNCYLEPNPIGPVLRRVGSRPPQCDKPDNHGHRPLDHADCRWGGISAKTDPGPSWNWNDYIARIKGTSSTVPSSPQNLAAAEGDGRVDLSWSPPSTDGGASITAYKIYKGTTSGGESFFKQVGNVLSYTDTAVTNGITYYYKVSAVNSIGEGSLSNEDNATPHASSTVNPPTLKTPEDGSVVTTKTPTFTWTSDPNADYHALYIEQQGADGVWVRLYDSELLDGPIYGDSFQLPSGSSLLNGSYNSWNMRSNNDGLWSDTTSFWYFMVSVSPVIPPSAPRNLQAAEGDSRVDLSWDPPADDGGNPIALYYIYRGTDPNQYIPPLSGGVIDGSVRTYTDTAVTNGITYYYQVSAVTSPGRNLEGPRSRIVEATPGGGATIPPVPALIGPGTTAEPGETISTLTPTLQWNSASGATYYKVYVSKSPYGSSDIVYSNENVAGTSIPLPSNALQQGTKYNWDVGACNSAGCSEQSSDLYFQTETPVYNTAFLTNAQLTNYKSMSTRQIRNFLVKYNSYFRKSVLDVDGVSFDAATVISQAAQKYQINPKVILATLQKENQGVTTATRPSDSTMKFLMGCVSSSTARAQLTCAAERFRAYHNQLTNTGATVSGWKVGVPKTTQDGVVVTPATKAVAGQFTYTPLAGVQWGGNDPRWGGVYLFYYWWNYFGFA